MAVLGASRAFKDWQTANGLVDPEPAEGEEAREKEYIDPAEIPVSNLASADGKDISDAELQALEDEDPLSMIDSLSTRVGPKAATTISSTSFSLWSPATNDSLTSFLCYSL